MNSGRWCISGFSAGNHDPISHDTHGGAGKGNEDADFMVCFEKKSIDGIIDHRGETYDLMRGQVPQHFQEFNEFDEVTPRRTIRQLPEPNYYPVEIPYWIKEDEEIYDDWSMFSGMG